jgi:hypothetical protein
MRDLIFMMGTLWGRQRRLVAGVSAACGLWIFGGTSRSLTYPFWSTFECVSRIEGQFLAKPATAMGVSAR